MISDHTTGTEDEGNPMIVTVFRSRLRSEAIAEYTAWATRMSELAATMPGHVSHKTFTAEDGERVTVIEFESEAAQRNWSVNVEHVRAKAKGREAFYAEYKLQVCELVRESRFQAAGRD